MIKSGMTEVGETDDRESGAAWRESSRGEGELEESG